MKRWTISPDLWTIRRSYLFPYLLNRRARAEADIMDGGLSSMLQTLRLTEGLELYKDTDPANVRLHKATSRNGHESILGLVSVLFLAKMGVDFGPTNPIFFFITNELPYPETLEEAEKNCHTVWDINGKYRSAIIDWLNVYVYTNGLKDECDQWWFDREKNVWRHNDDSKKDVRLLLKA